MKILGIDIETQPNVGHVWQLFNQNVGLAQLIQSHDVICFAAGWYSDREVIFKSKFHDGYIEMLTAAWSLLDEADVVVHYNGKKFDIPHLNRAFIVNGMVPPSPYKQVDLLQVVRQNFRFASNKLAHVSVELGIGAKEHHEGHELWVGCMAGKKSSWNTMRKYNKQDTALLFKLYDKLMPWIKGHPNHNLYVDEDSRLCPNCGSSHLHKRGSAYTGVSRFIRYRCMSCGKWCRGRSNQASRQNALVGIV